MPLSCRLTRVEFDEHLRVDGHFQVRIEGVRGSNPLSSTPTRPEQRKRCLHDRVRQFPGKLDLILLCAARLQLGDRLRDGGPDDIAPALLARPPVHNAHVTSSASPNASRDHHESGAAHF